MKKYKKLKSKDGNCPYCSSDFVMKMSEASSSVASSEEEYEDGLVFWKCYRCNKEFFCREEE
jgi:uncharacterized protein with PIN domain